MSDQRADDGPQLVVVGSSVGGIDALCTLVAGLSRPFPAPIVLAQHLDPRRPSRLAEILARRTAFPVREVTDTQTLEPGTIFVVPADRQVEITGDQVQVHADPVTGPKPSVDRLFESAATAFGERLVAVILTGMGSDGAAGARYVKAAGGTVIIQNPATAAYPAMPESLAPNTVDIVANLEAIPALLQDLLSGAYLPPRPDEDRTLRGLLEQLREHRGIDFSTYKRPTIMRRLQRRMAATGTTRIRDYVRYLQAHPDEHRRLVSSFLIKVTELFRDPDLFEHLRHQILPALASYARENGA